MPPGTVGMVPPPVPVPVVFGTGFEVVGELPVTRMSLTPTRRLAR